MQDILRYINSVEGVIGSAVFNDHGEVVDHAFPPIIEGNALKTAAGLALECSYGLQISGSLDLIDLRFSEGRIIIKAFPGAMLYLLCSKNANLQVLTITLNLAAKKLEPMLAGSVPPAPTPAAVTATPEAPVAMESDDDGSTLKLRISHLANKDASKSFDSLGMIAVSQPTSAYITDFYKNPFKKLILTNTAAGTSGTFPVMVMKDLDTQFDGTIIVGPGIEKKLQVNEGDKVEIKIG
jgi:predicted regulator of Ras-like GTPase activity (Roadblock/LC7/MglB family)